MTCMMDSLVGTQLFPPTQGVLMTSTPIEPDIQPDTNPDGVPGDNPDVPQDPDQQDPDIVTDPNAGMGVPD